MATAFLIQHEHIRCTGNWCFCGKSGNHTGWLFSSVIMQFVSHRGHNAERFVFGKHIIHAVDIILVTLAVDVSLIIKNSMYPGCKNKQPFL